MRERGNSHSVINSPKSTETSRWTLGSSLPVSIPGTVVPAGKPERTLTVAPREHYQCNDQVANCNMAPRGAACSEVGLVGGPLPLYHTLQCTLPRFDSTYIRHTRPPRAHLFRLSISRLERDQPFTRATPSYRGDQSYADAAGRGDHVRRKEGVDVSPVGHDVQVGGGRHHGERAGGGGERRARNSNESSASHLRSSKVG